MKVFAYAAIAAGFVASTSLPAAAQDFIKIGVLVSYSGMGSLGGQQTDAAIKLFQQKNGDSPGGKKIEFVRRDTTGPNPEVAKRLVQEVVTRDKVQILIGPDFTPNTLAAAPIVTEAKVPTMVIGAATTGIIGEKSPYFTRTFFAIPQLCKPLASYAVKNNWKKVYVMVADFAPGHDCERYFNAELAAQGGTVAGNLRIPLSNPEFSSYMQRIKDAKPDALFIFMPLGELSIGSLRAANDSGLKASGVKIIGTGDITDETYVDGVGDAALGTLTTGIYSTQHDSPMNKEFVQRLRRAQRQVAAHRLERDHDLGRDDARLRRAQGAGRQPSSIRTSSWRSCAAARSKARAARSPSTRTTATSCRTSISAAPTRSTACCRTSRSPPWRMRRSSSHPHTAGGHGR